MKLVSFQVRTPVGTFTRIGALHNASIVDLNMAQARRLTDQGETLTTVILLSNLEFISIKI